MITLRILEDSLQLMFGNRDFRLYTFKISKTFSCLYNTSHTNLHSWKFLKWVFTFISSLAVTDKYLSAQTLCGRLRNFLYFSSHRQNCFLECSPYNLASIYFDYFSFFIYDGGQRSGNLLLLDRYQIFLSFSMWNSQGQRKMIFLSNILPYLLHYTYCLWL